MGMRRKYDFRIYNDDILVSKECGKCLTYKSVEEFTEDPSHKDGYTPKCTDCLNSYQKTYWKEYFYPANKTYYQEYYTNNREYFQEHNREYYLNNKEK